MSKVMEVINDLAHDVEVVDKTNRLGLFGACIVVAMVNR